MNILITGGAGFIGSHTVIELAHKGFCPIIVDDFRNSEKFVLDRIQQLAGLDIKVYNVDCGDFYAMEKIFQKEKPKGIIHFAADKAVNESVINPIKYYNNNIGSLVCLLRLIEIYPVSSFVFSSSCTVYGNPDIVPVTEKSPIKTAFSPYGYTKQVGEQCLKDFHNNHSELSVIILRYFNPIGAHPSSLIGELPIGVPNNLIPFVTQTAAGIRKKLTVFGNDYDTEDGFCVRDYIHVVDLANSHVIALNYGKSNPGIIDIFNVGTGKGTSVLSVIETFEKITNTSVQYIIGPRRKGDAACVYADNSYITNKLNWEPSFSLSDSLLHAWEWQKTL